MMNPMLLYFLKSGLALAIFYLFFRLFLSGETIFKANRFYLLSALIVSVFLPLHIFSFTIPDTGQLYHILLDGVTVDESIINVKISPQPELLHITGFFYFAVSAMLIFRFLVQIARLTGMILNNGITKYNNVKVVFTNEKFAPFSFFNLIFIPRQSDDDQTIDEIIEHEKVHIRQWHSLDIILVEMLIVLQWFNPVVWQYRKSLKLLHEYLADEGVLKKGFNPVAYQNLLLTQSIGLHMSTLTNNFNHSLIKNRIVMMTKTKSGLAARLKVMFAAPLALMLALFVNTIAIEPAKAQVDQKPPQKIEVPADANQTTETEESPTFLVVDQMPQYPGGDEALMRFLIENIKYPEAARNAGKQGAVFVSFVVEKNGNITNTKVIRGFDEECDAVAVKTVQAMPDWIAGKQNGENVRVQFTLPLRFTLDKETKEEKPE